MNDLESQEGTKGEKRMGYDPSTEFIKKPHEWDPRRLYSQTGADGQYRVLYLQWQCITW
ncbi:MAG: hypothetical protein ABIH23_26890 [bacterium]